MVYALLRCHVRNTLKRGAFWRPSGPDTPARFTPRATWSSLELTRVVTIARPGGTKIFFSNPPSVTVFALGSLVDVGPLQWPGGR